MREEVRETWVLLSFYLLVYFLLLPSSQNNRPGPPQHSFHSCFPVLQTPSPTQSLPLASPSLILFEIVPFLARLGIVLPQLQYNYTAQPFLCGKLQFGVSDVGFHVFAISIVERMDELPHLFLWQDGNREGDASNRKVGR
jgi:hypothetical protein